MQPQKPAVPSSPLHEIFKWSAARPDWQRDALRRIVVQGTIGETDVKELDRICRGKHGADASTELAVVAKPWQYVLIPHTAIADNMTLKGLVKQYGT